MRSIIDLGIRTRRLFQEIVTLEKSYKNRERLLEDALAEATQGVGSWTKQRKVSMRGMAVVVGREQVRFFCALGVLRFDWLC